MKTITFIIALIIGNTALSQVSKTGDLNVTVSNCYSEEGQVIFALYSSDVFQQKEPDFTKKVSIIEGVASAKFDNLPAGTYAIVCLHDKNENGRMDFDSSGRPLESYGTSNNPMMFGPPSWEESKFAFLGEEMELEIRF